MITSGLTIQNRAKYQLYPSQHFSHTTKLIRPHVSTVDRGVPIEYNKFLNEDIPISIRYRDIFGKNINADDKLYFLMSNITKKEQDAQKLVQRRVKSGLARTNKFGTPLTATQVQMKILEKAVIDDSTPMEGVIDYYEIMESLRAVDALYPEFEPLYTKAKQRINRDIYGDKMDIDRPEKPSAVRRKYEKMLVDKPERFRKQKIVPTDDSMDVDSVRVRKQKIVPTDDGMDVDSVLPAIDMPEVGMTDSSMIPVPPPPPSVPMDIYEAEMVNAGGARNALKHQIKLIQAGSITKEALVEALENLKPTETVKSKPEGLTKEDIVAQLVKLRPTQTVKRIFESTSLFTPQELTEARDVLKRKIRPEEPVLGRVRPDKRRGSIIESEQPKRTRIDDRPDKRRGSILEAEQPKRIRAFV